MNNLASVLMLLCSVLFALGALLIPGLPPRHSFALIAGCLLFLAFGLHELD